MMSRKAVHDEKAMQRLARGAAIPAHPLALSSKRKLDERRQRALSRYYLDSGAGGLAVGVHSTQFEIRRREHNLYRPVLTLAAEEMARYEQTSGRSVVRIAGVCGKTPQAVREASLAMDLGYHAVLLSLGAFKKADDDQLVDHCKAVGDVAPLVGFYLQPSVGGRVLSVDFWRRFAQIPAVAAIKIAPFNRYQTLDVVRAVAEAGRALDEKGRGIALYTGNDDNILGDLLGEWTFHVAGKSVTQRVVGGLLGHWACWTRKAVDLLEHCHKLNASGRLSPEILLTARQVTDMNAAVFDVANKFAGCIPGIHEVLRRQGLLGGLWCLDPELGLGPGQAQEITRVCKAYPHLTDDDFVSANLDRWLSG